MKRALLTLFATLFATLTFAQEQRLTRSERFALDGKETNLFATFATGFSGGDFGTVFKMEYNRQLSGNWFWGVSTHWYSTSDNDWELVYEEPYYDYSTEEYCDGYYDTYSVGSDRDIFNVSGMIYYRIHVVKDRLMLRPGFGAGLNYLNESFEERGVVSYNDDFMLSYSLELAWILRISKHFEFKFAPLVFAPYSLLPQNITISKSLGDGDFNFACDYLFNVGVGVRF